MTNLESKNNLITYNSNDGKTSFSVNVLDETVWLTQKQMAELFDKDRSVITKHINNIFKEGELKEKEVCAKFAHTTQHGAVKGKTQVQAITMYNLDVIISVGYRVKSKRGVEFRRWATSILKQYLLNGYAINDNKIKLIEDKIDTLYNNLKAESFELRSDIKEIYKILNQISNKPINIHNHINFAGNKLQEKLIELIDQLIVNIKNDDDLVAKLKELESEIKISPKDQNTKQRITKFFEELGDNNSTLSKKITGIDRGKKIISQLIEIGKKLTNLF